MPSKTAPIEPGTLYSFELPNGLYGACQVLGTQGDQTFVGILSGTWPAAPTAKACAAAAPLRPVRFAYNGDKVSKHALACPPPPEFKLVGTARVHRDWAPALMPPYELNKTWSRIPEVVWFEWRWIHDRAAFEAEAEVRRKELAKRVAEHQAQRQSKWAAIPDEDLAKQRPFAGWSRMWGKTVAQRANAIFQETAKALFSDRIKPRVALKKMIAEFNALEAKSSCIETEEREQIWEYGEDLARRAGILSAWPKIFEDRDW